MTKISCFSALFGGKSNKSKDVTKVSYAKRTNGNDRPKVKPVAAVKGSDNDPPTRDTIVAAQTTVELSCKCRGDNDGKALLKSAPSDADLAGYSTSDGADRDAIGAALGVRGGRAVPAASARLQRSCSNIETARSKAFGVLPAKARSHNDLAALPAQSAATPDGAPDASPTASVKTVCSADHVMLKRHSSSQVLPSRSRKLWWRLFMWSHRNLHRPAAAMPNLLPPAGTDDARCQHDAGYTSDTLDAGIAAADRKNKEIAVDDEEPIQNQWVAFSAEASSLDRVGAWVSSLGDGSLFHIEEEEGITEHDGGAVRPHCPEIGESSSSVPTPHARRRTADEAVQASSIVQSLNAFSTVAHISSMGLKVLPMISSFSSLRAVNLSGNFIAHISPGSLPKGLHSLDLSRNKIAAIEGLRELTKLRMLNLNYNRISRIGHGLSNCTAIRELYLAGNKIGDVEGLHRLLKLTVLDLSFNKISTTQALGQLVANYGSVRALNLLGNPVQTNNSDETLRKMVSGLLPGMEYLNRQAVKPQRAREVAKDSVAKAALGNSGWRSRRRVTRRLSQCAGSAGKGRASELSSSHRGGRSRSKNRSQSSSLARS